MEGIEEKRVVISAVAFGLGSGQVVAVDGHTTNTDP